MLDRTTEAAVPSAETPRPVEAKPRPKPSRLRRFPKQIARIYGTRGWRGLAQGGWRFLGALTFSSLTRRIIFLNVAGLAALVVGILYLSQFRAGLIDARIQSLVVQGQIIANAIASSGTVDTYRPFIERDRQYEFPNEGLDEGVSGLEFSINPERVAPILRSLITPTGTRARIYDTSGYLLLDSRNLYIPGEVIRFDLPPPSAEKPNIFRRAWQAFRTWLGRGDLPLYRELGPDAGMDYPEVAGALIGHKDSMVRINEYGVVIVSVAVPIQRFRAVRGALLLSTQGGDIDQAVENERLVILKVFGIAAVIMVLLSIFFAGTIAGPVRRLAAGAESVRQGIRSRVQIPDFTRRRDEIGHLSGALRAMTDALYTRIEAIESFAADVAHELKNPLTSLRSAVETLPLARSNESRERLLAVIQHDVKRLDRLISDISDASRLDADLQRQERAPVDLTRLLNTVVGVQNEVRHAEDVDVTLAFEGGGPSSFVVPGHDSRLGQVIDNLIANARSFSPPGGTVRVIGRRVRDQVEIIVDDDGPGIRPEAFSRIFERFYTDRPHQGFGQNSGLGLSISKQIVEAHGGRIWAENRESVGGGETKVLGARFVIRLPVT